MQLEMRNRWEFEKFTNMWKSVLILDLQKSCQDNTGTSYIPFTEFPQVVKLFHNYGILVTTRKLALGQT